MVELELPLLKGGFDPFAGSKREQQPWLLARRVERRDARNIPGTQ